MHKTVIFDLGNVLVFFNFEKIFSQVSKITGLPPEKIKELLIKKGLQSRYESGLLSSEELYRIFALEAAKPFSAKDFFYAASDIFQPNEPMVPLLKKLKKKGLRLIILSNTNPAHYEFLESRLPALKLFDAKILSFEVGALKPQPKIYSAAIQAAHCSPQECFYTDDIHEYVLAARTHGVDAEVFIDADESTKQFEKRHLI